MAKRATLSDVAREAGVSLATASRAINGSATRVVQPELQARVLAAAEKLRYIPDANAQAMARGETDTIGLIVHDIADPYFSSIAAGVAQAADAAGLVVTLVSTQHEPHRERTFLDLLRRQRTRSVIIAGGRSEDPDLNAQLRRSLADYVGDGGRVALIGQPLLEVNTVQVANAAGANQLANHFSERGYRKIAVLAGPANHLTARERARAFTDQLRVLGYPAPLVVHSSFTRDGGSQGLANLLTQGADFDAVFAVNDVMALGALAAARRAGLEVPRDFALAGFDDIPTLQDVVPELTTVRIPLVEVGKTAAELALDSGGKVRVVPVSTQLVVRQTTPKI